MIENYQLEQLLAFHEYGTLSAAAEHLDIAEPSLSRTMKKLEEELGVQLFERRKNRIALNQTGVLAVDHARLVLSKVEEMGRDVRSFDRSLRALTIGSCSFGPLIELRPMAAGLYPTLDISSSVKGEEALIRGLQRGEYNMIVLSHPLEQQGLLCLKYRTDQIYLSVKENHPLADRRTVSFSELDGQTFIAYTHEDQWTALAKNKLPHSKFFYQEDIDALISIVQNSEFPSFSSDIFLEHIESYRTDRVNIPISDPEGMITAYLICKSSERQKWSLFFEKLQAVF